jgi:hypothetical protein
MPHRIQTHILQLGAVVSCLQEWFATFGWTTRFQITGLSRVGRDYVCSSQGKTSMSFCFCEDCDVGICVSQHTTLSLTTDLEKGSPSKSHYCRAYSKDHSNSDLRQSDYSVEFSSLYYGGEEKYG